LNSLIAASFEFKNHTVFIKGKDMKNGDDVVQAVSEQASKIFQKYVADLEPDEKLFKIPDKSSKMMQTDCKAAGIDVEKGRAKLKFHTLRHSCGTFLANKGVHPKVIQEIMRHKDINLTMSRYTHTLQNQVADAVIKISELSI
jgi:integrase